MLLANRVLIGSLALGAPVLADESGPAIDEKAQPDSAVRGEGALTRFINTPWAGDFETIKQHTTQKNGL